MVLRLGVQLVAAGDGADFDAALVGGVTGDEFVERVLHGEFFFAESGGQLVDRGGLVGGVDDGFECGFAFVGGHRQRQFTVKSREFKGAGQEISGISNQEAGGAQPL